jgi:hypothetical protein
MNLAFGHFPGFEEEYKKTVEDYKNALAVREKFNGELVSEWTGLTERALGSLMMELKNSFSSKEKLNEWVLASTSEHVKAFVLLTLNKMEHK